MSTDGHFKDENKNDIPIKIDEGGYIRIKTSVGYRQAHRLVMLTWKNIPDAENLTVDHINHNKRDNSLKNLEWVSQEENRNRAKEDRLSAENFVLNEKIFYVTLNGIKFSLKDAANFLININNAQASKILKLLYRVSTKGEKLSYCGIKIHPERESSKCHVKDVYMNF